MSEGRESFYRTILENLSDGVYFTDRERRISYWNRGAERLSGFASHEVIGKSCSDNLLIHVDRDGNQLCQSGCPLAATLEDGQPREVEVFLHHKDGHRVPVITRVSPIRDAEERITGAVEIFSSNSAKAQLEDRLAEMERLALVDALTGLPNRRFLESHIRSRLEELRRNQWDFAVLFIDIDRFKQINDEHGHGVGDRILRVVGRTLDANSRYFDVIGRWGGEEFVAVIANTHACRLLDVGERFRMLVARATLDDQPQLTVTISLGGAEAVPEDTVESLLQRADANLYAAKEQGRNRVCV